MPGIANCDPVPNWIVTGRLAVGRWLFAAMLVLVPAIVAASVQPPFPKPRPVGAAIPVPLPRPYPVPPANRSLEDDYRYAFRHAHRGNWRNVARDRRPRKDPALEKVLTWLAFKHPRSGAGFAEISRFLDANPDWPDGHHLQIQAEAVMNRTVPLQDRLTWFAQNATLTTKGHLKRIAALAEAGRETERKAAIREAWYLADFTRAQLQDFIKQHGAMIDADLRWKRLNHLLWLGKTWSARSMLSLVAPPLRRLAEARIRLRRRAGGVDRAIARVPADLRPDPGLIYERLRWRRKKGLWDRARSLLDDTPDNPDFPGLWWRERDRHIRRSLADGEFEAATALAVSHRQREGPAYSEAQWLAGWTTLRFRNDPDCAKRYFTAMHKAVRTPISLARAAYWAGRAFEAGGDAAGAKLWYARAAEHPTAYYGQLAAARNGGAAKHLPIDPIATYRILKDSQQRDLMATVSVLKKAGQQKLARKFLNALVGTTATPEALAAATAFARRLDFRDISVKAARHAARDGVILMKAGYPVIPLPAGIEPEPALVHAIIRQESNFDATVGSSAGALGLMQLMPSTAQLTARQMQLAYRRANLLREPVYNIRLGSYYLQRQIDEFGGSYILAIAAYNAGPGRVRKWIAAHGDPRHPDVDEIDWIERIPFSETRNYVQRVLENLEVYRQRLGSPSVNRVLPS